jgi:hemerythrin-like domain-containing protein
VEVIFMFPTDLLKNEHRVIEQVLCCLEKLAERCDREGHLDKPAAERALDFLRIFADGCHHAKEERHLFPLLEARGVPRERGPTAVMRCEHDQGRRHVAAMTEAVRGAAAGHYDDVTEFIAEARAYVRLLRDHITKEERCLFPLANQALSSADQGALLAAFEKVEDEKEHGKVHDLYLHLADDLADDLQVPHPEVNITGPVGCCSHSLR